jgi:hypothetical protein
LLQDLQIPKIYRCICHSLFITINIFIIIIKIKILFINKMEIYDSKIN